MDKYQSDRSLIYIYIYIYICPLGVLNKYTFDIRISMCPTGDKYKYMYKLSTVYEESE